MPVGKNSIKRVSNNGYSNVTTAAPDMENSTVEEVVATTEKKPVAKKPVAKKPTAKKPKAEKPEEKKPKSPTPVSDNTPETEAEDGFVTFTLGEDLPYYLL